MMDSSSGKEPVKLLALGGLSHSLAYILSITCNILVRRRRHSWALRAAHNQTNHAQDYGRRERETKAGWQTASYLSAQAVRLV